MADCLANRNPEPSYPPLDLRSPLSYQTPTGQLLPSRLLSSFSRLSEQCGDRTCHHPPRPSVLLRDPWDPGLLPPPSSTGFPKLLQPLPYHLPPSHSKSEFACPSLRPSRPWQGPDAPAPCIWSTLASLFWFPLRGSLSCPRGPFLGSLSPYPLPPVCWSWSRPPTSSQLWIQ